MSWTVVFSNKSRKQKEKLPRRIQELLFQLVRDIEKTGPVRGDWPNYGKLSDSEHHCHLKKGKPTFVAVWREEKGNVSLVEVSYAGTHEKAPY
jgi:mRNA-degrading endonuclease RelE of RelBE toxin-antitoxin system